MDQSLVLCLCAPRPSILEHVVFVLVLLTTWQLAQCRKHLFFSTKLNFCGSGGYIAMTMSPPRGVFSVHASFAYFRPLIHIGPRTGACTRSPERALGCRGQSVCVCVRLRSAPSRRGLVLVRLAIAFILGLLVPKFNGIYIIPRIIGNKHAAVATCYGHKGGRSARNCHNVAAVCQPFS